MDVIKSPFLGAKNPSPKSFLMSWLVPCFALFFLFVSTSSLGQSSFITVLNVDQMPPNKSLSWRKLDNLKIQNDQGGDTGEIDNLIVDDAGKVTGVIIRDASETELGNALAVVPWSDLIHSNSGLVLTLKSPLSHYEVSNVPLLGLNKVFWRITDLLGNRINSGQQIVIVTEFFIHTDGQFIAMMTKPEQSRKFSRLFGTPRQLPEPLVRLIRGPQDIAIEKILSREYCGQLEAESLRKTFKQLISQSDKNHFLDNGFVNNDRSIQLKLSATSPMPSFDDAFGAPLLRSRGTLDQACSQRAALIAVADVLKKIKEQTNLGNLSDSLTCMVAKASDRIFGVNSAKHSSACNSKRPKIIFGSFNTVTEKNLNSVAEAHLWLSNADYDAVAGAASLLASSHAHIVGDLSGSRSQANLSENLQAEVRTRLHSPRIKLGATPQDKEVLKLLGQLQKDVTSLFTAAQ